MEKDIFTEKEREHISNFFPSLFGKYCISVKLPEKYKDYAPHIYKNEKFRERVKETLEEELIKGTYVEEIILIWDNRGLSFQVNPGINGCAVYIASSPDGYCYAHHNIDNSHQANVLYTALSLYLRELYSLLTHVRLTDLSKLKKPETNLRIKIPLKYE